MWSSYYKAVWTDTKEGAEIEAPKKQGQTELLKRSEPIPSDGPHAVRKVDQYGLTLSGETFQDGISISRKSPASTDHRCKGYLQSKEDQG